MPKKNKPTDVFRSVDMRGGDREQCWPWTASLPSSGRPTFTLDGKKIIAYRLVYELTTGDILGDRLARHKCDNEVCCNPYHIVPGSHEQNMDDMKTRQRHGLPHNAVRAIRKSLAGGMTQAVVAELFGVSRETISAIATERVYAHVNTVDEKTTK